MKTSKLVALSPKTYFGTNSNSSNILNPSLGSGISKTPSPIGSSISPLSLNTLDNYNNIPSLSPAPSPINKSPIVNDIRQSLADIKALPAQNSLSNLSYSNSGISPDSPFYSDFDELLPESPLEKSSVNVGTSVAPESPFAQSLRDLENSSGNVGTSVAPESPFAQSLRDLENSSGNVGTSIAPESPFAQSLSDLEKSSGNFSSSLDNLQDFNTPGPISFPPTGSLKNSLDKDLKPLDNIRTVVDEDAKSSISFHNMSGELEDKDIEQSLLESGYVPVDKIFTKDENDNLMCQYIKAVDTTGRTSFVDLDEEGYVTANKNDISMTKQSKASIVPYSVKMGTYECASSDVCGVAFECNNEVCTLKRSDNTLEPTESVFTYSKSPKSDLVNKSHGMLEENPIAYPIVLLSEIKKNPLEVSKSIRESHDRMRNVAFGQCSKDANKLISSTKTLNLELDRYKKNLRNIALTLTKTIKELETIHSNFKKNPPVTDKGKDNLRLVHFNLRKRHDLVIDLLKSCEAINSKNDKIRDLTNEIKEINDFNEMLFDGVDGVFTQ